MVISECYLQLLLVLKIHFVFNSLLARDLDTSRVLAQGIQFVVDPHLLEDPCRCCIEVQCRS